MLKVLGAILVFGGCAGMGWTAVKRLDRRLNTLRSVLSALDLMMGELEFRLPAMEELLFATACHAGEPAAGFLRACAGEQRQTEDRPFGEIWSKAAKEYLSVLKPDDLQEVLSLGEVLGRYDCEGQLRAMGRVSAVLARSLEEAAVQRQEHGKVYRVLGMTAGALFVILLL